MDIRARRVYRMSFATALSLAVAYGLGLTFAFVAPLFAFVLTIRPAPPMRAHTLLILLLVIALTTSTGLLLVPMLMHYPVAAFLIVALGLYLSFLLTIQMQQQMLGLFVAIGFTLISAAGLEDFALGQQLVISLVGGVFIAVIALWLIYPLFPEDAPTAGASPPARPARSREANLWISLRGTLLVLPVYFLALNNPSLYVAAILKSVSLSQQTSLVDARHAGQELLASTFLGACFAALFWILLRILPHLWLFTLLMLAFSLFMASRIHLARERRVSAGFWPSVMITMLILLGPAIMDLRTGEDVYMASFTRLVLFLFVTLYAWGMLALLEALRHRRQRASTIDEETVSC